MGFLNLIMLRHGQSIWNQENRFTGWTDVDLSDQGIGEAHQAGKTLKAEGYSFDVAFTSVLKRAIRTLWIVLDEMDLMWIPVHRSWRLSERHYGALQGLNIPTGIPVVYELNNNLSVVSHYYLSKEEAIKKASKSVANQVNETFQTP